MLGTAVLSVGLWCETASAVNATGGTVTTNGDYRIHTFTASGTFSIPSSASADVLVVAGGGGGGGVNGGGGGGAGGLIYTQNVAISGSYSITVGAGGAGVTGTNGLNGSNSVFGSIIAYGGGGGGGGAYVPGVSGGSGGGGALRNSQPGGSGTVGQGNAGGASCSSTTAGWHGGGGGGGAATAGTAGSNAGSGTGSPGGNGVTNYISGTARTYAGGGGGGGASGAGLGGIGGGGRGVTTGNGNSGTNSTGGGGGGSEATATAGGSGGSGIVIVRYNMLTPGWSGTGVSNVTTESAMAYATLDTTNADVYLFWDTTDKSTTCEAWGNTNFVGANVNAGLISGVAISNLTAGASYTYRFYGTNATSGLKGWSAPGTLITGEVTVTATVATVSELGPAGQFTVCRPAALTNDPLTVAYAVGGGAAEGMDYQTLSRSVTIPAGSASATVAVIPFDNAVIEGNRGVTLTVLPGAYVVGTPNSAAITITDDESAANYAYKARIVFAGYGRAETLTNFPALVMLGPATPSGFDYGQMFSANGRDLRFFSDDLTQVLSHEVETWDPATNSSVWVQVPALTDTNTAIWACWGNANATSAPAYYTTNGATWANGYRAVYHFANNLNDATSNRVTGVNNGTVTTNGAPGCGYGRAFGNLAASSNSIGLAASSVYLPAANAPVTVSAWCRPSLISLAEADNRIFSTVRSGAAGSTAFTFALGRTNRVQLSWRSPGAATVTATITSTVPVSASAWTHVAATYDGTVGTVWIAGVPVGSATQTLDSGTNGVAAQIGRFSDGGSGNNAYYRGDLDEVRISSVARSSNWLWACYMNQASNTPGFAAYGAAASAGAGGMPPAIENEAPTNITTSAACFNGWLRSVGSSPTTVKVLWGTGNGGIPGTWQYTNACTEGDWTEGSHPTTNIVFPTANRMYFYTYYATNSGGEDWPPAGKVQSLLAGEVTIAAGANGSEVGPANGSFTVSRNVEATNGELTVYYTVDQTVADTAIHGVDYAALPGSVTLPAGAASATIIVQVVQDETPEPTETVKLALAPGPYTIGAQSNAEVTITNWVPAAVKGVDSSFDPAAYPVLNLGSPLHPTTSLAIFTGTAASPTPTITIDGGSPINGVVVTNQSRQVALALFCFNAIDIPAGFTIGVTGDRGLVLASRSDLVLSNGLSLAGGNGEAKDVKTATPVGGAGGSGAEGGVAGSSFSSRPPGSTKGKGGDGKSFGSNPGVGYGAGLSTGSSQDRSHIGAGGGYAGAGGDAGVSQSWDGNDYLFTANSGGKAYGDVLLTDLYGGSGGSSGSAGRSYTGCSGGGGGGALELVASGTLRIGVGKTVSVQGGDGGRSGNGGGAGGSGGGILLAAPTVNLQGSTVNIGGGGCLGGSATVGGSGASGGRLAIYAESYTGGTVNRNGGNGPNIGASGSDNVSDLGIVEWFPFGVAKPAWAGDTDAKWTASAFDRTGGDSTATAVGDLAVFGTNATAYAVSVEGAAAVGGIRFEGANAYTLVDGGGTIAMSANRATNSPAYVVSASTNADHTVNAPLSLASDLEVRTDTAGRNVTLGGAIGESAAGKRLVKLGLGTATLTGTNAYTGATLIGGGTLGVSVLTDGGIASPLGASGSAAGNLILNGGTLKYVGAGHSTDRLFTLGGFGGAIDASGSGVVTFAGTGDMACGAVNMVHTLVLRGTNTGDNTLAAVIGNYSSTYYTSLTKSDGGTWVLTGTNTYTGPTTINGGTLRVGTLANGGSASAIGASANTAGNLTINGGTLKYTGGAVSISRLFALGTTGMLDASGTGALSLTNTGTMGFVSATARTLTLAGNNTNDNTLAAGIANNTGATSLTKTGAGTWVLTGSNTYTGATLVNGGKLLVNGTLDVTAVTVTNGATLGGMGTIKGTVNVTTNSHLAPGGSSGAGTLTLTNSLTLRNGAVLDFSLWGAAVTNRIRLTGGTFTGTGVGGVTVNLTESPGFVQGSAYTLIDWTGATASGVDVGDFVATRIPSRVITLAIVGNTLQVTMRASAGTVVIFR
jgi:autotransporter-associated beta strand protein